MKSWQKTLVIAFSAIVLGIIAGGILMALIGANPLEAYYYLIQGSLLTSKRFANMLAVATPLIMTGLSVAFAFRTGLFNIGAAGQFLVGGFIATAIGLSAPLPSFILVPIMVLAGTLGGALWGVVPGFLKARFNVHEVVATIMMNFIALQVVYYAVPYWFKGSFETESRHLALENTLKNPELGRLFLDPNAKRVVESMTDQKEVASFLMDYSFINMGIVIALIMVVVVYFLIDHTTKGFELRAVGFNRNAAEYAGMPVKQNIVLSMAIAGGLAGMGGVMFYAGYSTSLQIGILPPQGFDGIAVALLGANSPFGALAAALFFAILQSGRGFMNANTIVPPEIGEVIIAVIIYFSATAVLIENTFAKIKGLLKHTGKSKNDLGGK